MISKAKIKFIRSLEQKKHRQEEHLFVAEGPKVVGDILVHYTPRLLVATPQWLKEQAHNLPVGVETIEATEDELRKVSFLQHPQQVLAVFPMPSCQTCKPEQAANPLQADTSLLSGTPTSEEGNLHGAFELPTHQLSLALDGVQDPGNLGTIIRIADWFGITTLVCSPDTADAYNPKVVQATMGSIARVRIIYTDLVPLLDSQPKDFPVYGTLLDGNNIYGEQLSSQGLIVMGNEGKGLSQPVRQRVNHRLFIPSFPPDRETAESLNVAIATAVTCAEFRRRRY